MEANRRRYANQIQVAVDVEFNRIFASARAQGGYCSFAQGYYRVFHYCCLPLNHRRTLGGAQVGQLIHPQAYDTINIDSLRWILPSNFERATLVASRLIRPIVDHYIHGLGQLGVRVPPVLGEWGFPFDISNLQGFKYVLRLIGAPKEDPFVRFTIENIRWRRFLASNYTVPNEYPWEDPLYMRHLVRYQNNDCVEPLGNLPTPLVQCNLQLIRFEDIDHYAT